MPSFDQAVLGLSVFLPIVGAALMLVLPGRHGRAHSAIGVGTTALVLAVGLALLGSFDFDQPGRQFVVDHGWIPLIDSRYQIAIDGLSLPLLLLSMLMTFLCAVYSAGAGHLPEPRNPKAFLILLLVLETGINGTFVAQDLILFFVFFELVLLPMYFLIGIWGGARRQYAALKFFLYTVLGSALMLLAFLGLYFLGGRTFDIAQLAAPDSEARALTHSTQLLLFAGLAVGFAVKVPVFPLHTWMPDAHTEAPTVASVMLAAVLLKLGGYGFLRIALPVLPDAAITFAPWLGLLAVIAILYGALGCLAQRDMKRLIAFSSLSHMGFVMLGIATLTDIGVQAAIFAMVAHGLISGLLFFLVGSVQQRLGTREIERAGGLLTVAPRLAWVLGFAAMASLGLPGLAGFWGEFSAILAAFSPADGLSVATFRTYMVLAAIGTVLAAGYLLWMYQRIAFGRPSDTVTETVVHDVDRTETLTWAPLVILIVVLGVLPSFVFDLTGPSVTELVRLMALR